jgi:hypothetical protein
VIWGFFASLLLVSPGRRIICVMTRRGNPNWGKPLVFPPAGPTEFDRQVRRLRLTRAQYVASAGLRRWCERHRNHFYVPEWLLEEWQIKVEDNFSAA